MEQTIGETWSGEAGKLGKLLQGRPECIAASWRRLCFATRRKTGELLLLDELVESFLQELGAKLNGKPGSPWGNTHGVLRLSRRRGTRGLQMEFAALQRCVVDAWAALGGTLPERTEILLCIAEASTWATAALGGLDGPGFPPLAEAIPFGGIVVELFDAEELSPLVDQMDDVQWASAQLEPEPMSTLRGTLREATPDMH